MPPESNPTLPGLLRWLTPFRMIVGGAILGSAASLTAASMSLTFGVAFARGSVSSMPFQLFQLGVAVALVMGPIGVFLVLYGIARAVRPRGPGASGHAPGLASAEAAGLPTASSQPTHWAPFRITLVGAFVSLAAGLGLAAFQISRVVFPRSVSGTDFAAYELTSATVLFAGAVAGALGALLAFTGIALALKNGPAQ